MPPARHIRHEASSLKRRRKIYNHLAESPEMVVLDKVRADLEAELAKNKKHTSAYSGEFLAIFAYYFMGRVVRNVGGTTARACGLSTIGTCLGWKASSRLK